LSPAADELQKVTVFFPPEIASVSQELKLGER